MECKRTITTMQRGHRKVMSRVGWKEFTRFCDRTFWLSRNLHEIRHWLQRFLLATKHSLHFGKKLHTETPHCFSYTFAVSEKVIYRFPYLVKDSRLLRNPEVTSRTFLYRLSLEFLVHRALKRFASSKRVDY